MFCDEITLPQSTWSIERCIQLHAYNKAMSHAPENVYSRNQTSSKTWHHSEKRLLAHQPENQCFTLQRKRDGFKNITNNGTNNNLIIIPTPHPSFPEQPFPLGFPLPSIIPSTTAGPDELIAVVWPLLITGVLGKLWAPHAPWRRSTEQLALRAAGPFGRVPFDLKRIQETANRWTCLK